MKITQSEEFELAFLSEKLSRRLAEDKNLELEADADFKRAKELMERSILFGRESAEPRVFQGLKVRAVLS